MSLPLGELKTRLLDILFLQDTARLTDTSALDETDWANLLAMVKEHRLGPLLHWRLTREAQDLSVSDSLLEFSEKSFKASTLRALMLQGELLKVHRILESVDIPHIALKGAWLAFHAYPHPALRPLRDLDILVPQLDVLTAYKALLDGGCARSPQYQGAPESVIKLSQHLPPLRSPGGKVSVELHHMLYHLDTARENGFELSGAEGLWQRCISADVVGASIHYLPPTELLLHLIVHGVYDHQFTNGPLLLSDLGYVLQKYPIDWPRFWDFAKRGGRVKGAVLALRLLENYRGKQPIDWCDSDEESADVHPGVIAASAQLMLRDFEARGDVNLNHAMGSKSSMVDKFGFMMNKAFPPRSNIAAIYPVSEDSPWVYLWYPVRWWRLLSTRLPGYLVAKRQAHLQVEANQLALLNSWLA